jgi:hypothetical protein
MQPLIWIISLSLCVCVCGRWYESHCHQWDSNTSYSNRKYFSIGLLYCSWKDIEERANTHILFSERLYCFTAVYLTSTWPVVDFLVVTIAYTAPCPHAGGLALHSSLLFHSVYTPHTHTHTLAPLTTPKPAEVCVCTPPSEFRLYTDITGRRWVCTRPPPPPRLCLDCRLSHSACFKQVITVWVFTPSLFFLSYPSVSLSFQNYLLDPTVLLCDAISLSLTHIFLSLLSYSVSEALIQFFCVNHWRAAHMKEVWVCVCVCVCVFCLIAFGTPQSHRLVFLLLGF